MRRRKCGRVEASFGWPWLRPGHPGLEAVPQDACQGRRRRRRRDSLTEPLPHSLIFASGMDFEVVVLRFLLRLLLLLLVLLLLLLLFFLFIITLSHIKSYAEKKWELYQRRCQWRSNRLEKEREDTKSLEVYVVDIYELNS